MVISRSTSSRSGAASSQAGVDDQPLLGVKVDLAQQRCHGVFYIRG
jgi:hypothetical protein